MLASLVILATLAVGLPLLVAFASNVRDRNERISSKREYCEDHKEDLAALVR